MRQKTYKWKSDKPNKIKKYEFIQFLVNNEMFKIINW